MFFSGGIIISWRKRTLETHINECSRQTQDISFVCKQSEITTTVDQCDEEGKWRDLRDKRDIPAYFFFILFKQRFKSLFMEISVESFRSYVCILNFSILLYTLVTSHSTFTFFYSCSRSDNEISQNGIRN